MNRLFLSIVSWLALTSPALAQDTATPPTTGSLAQSSATKSSPKPDSPSRQVAATEAPTKEEKKAKKTAVSKAEPAQANSPHPPKGGPSANPHAARGHGGFGQRAPQNRSMPDNSLPKGTVVVQVVDENNRPVTGATVKLLTSFMSVAEGNSEDVQTQTTNAQGETTFSGLDNAIRFTYAASVANRGATYDVAGFRLSKVGHRVLVHTFPVTTDPRAAFVGVQGFVTVRVNEDLIRSDVAYRVINMSRMTWRPSPIFIKLPDDAQGVEAALSSGDAGFEEAPGGVQLVGTFPPGQKDVPFTFYIPNKNEESLQIGMDVPTHTVDMNVLTEEAPGMKLSVSPGFQKAESRKGRDGKKVLITRRLMRPGDGQLSSVTIELSGLPVIGPGRWIASLLAVLIAALGGLGLWFSRKESDEQQNAQRDKARATLLDEMVLLERAHENGDVGPRTYEQTKREILAALARLEPQKTVS